MKHFVEEADIELFEKEHFVLFIYLFIYISIYKILKVSLLNSTVIFLRTNALP